MKQLGCSRVQKGSSALELRYVCFSLTFNLLEMTTGKLENVLEDMVCVCHDRTGARLSALKPDYNKV